MKTIIKISSFIVVLILPFMELIAQDNVQVNLDSRIRISTNSYIKNKTVYHVPAGVIFIGTIVELKADSLKLNVQDTDEVLAFPLSSINKFEVSQSRKKSHTLKGAVFGFIGGFFTGYIIAHGHEKVTGKVSDLDPRPFAGLVGGVVGALFGAVIGSNMGGEQWKEVSIKQIQKDL